MLVQLKRNWFAPNGVYYQTRDGLAEVPDEWGKKDKDGKTILPSDAIIMQPAGGLPFDTGKPKLPGFGAKPLHEQVLDSIAGGAPTHQITSGAGEGQEPASDEKLKEVAKELPKQIKDAKAKAEQVEKQKLDI